MQETYLVSYVLVYTCEMDDDWEDKKLQTIPRNISPLHSELTDLGRPQRYC